MRWLTDGTECSYSCRYLPPNFNTCALPMVFTHSYDYLHLLSEGINKDRLREIVGSPFMTGTAGFERLNQQLTRAISIYTPSPAEFMPKRFIALQRCERRNSEEIPKFKCEVDEKTSIDLDDSHVQFLSQFGTPLGCSLDSYSCFAHFETMSKKLELFVDSKKRKVAPIKEQAAPIDDSCNYAEKLINIMKSKSISLYGVGKLISLGFQNGSVTNVILTEIEGELAKNAITYSIDIGDMIFNTERDDSAKYERIAQTFLANLNWKKADSFKEKTKKVITQIAKEVKDVPTGLQLKGKVLNERYLTPSMDPFEAIDLNAVYAAHAVQGSDLLNQIKSLMRSILKTMTNPPLVIWKFTNCESQVSRESALELFPKSLNAIIERFIYDALGVFVPSQFENDVSREEELVNSSFYLMLSSTPDGRKNEFARRQQARLRMTTKLQQCMTKSLNYIRELHYNYEKKILEPCRNISHVHHVTWKEWQEASQDPIEFEQFQ
ncbi:unnamed protein product [Caenorhabditis bovis]|uniref:Uncharacterized protein n=1 Tax=Caenorhabditis bovis TaxID=2654633 RepID=A0A8S1F0V4_9PELO|nr:unnamed protein product [Caenorhabditis bovis]